MCVHICVSVDGQSKDSAGGLAWIFLVHYLNEDFIVWFAFLGCWAAFKCGKISALLFVSCLKTCFLDCRWEFVGWSFKRTYLIIFYILFTQLGFVWHLVALIFSVISCSLYSCMYVITIQNSFQTSLVLLFPIFLTPHFPLLSLFETLSYLPHHFSPPSKLPSPPASTPIFPVLVLLLCQFFSDATRTLSRSLLHHCPLVVCNPLCWDPPSLSSWW